MGKRIDREGPVHRAVLQYLRLALPGALIHHSAGESHLKGKAAMLATVKKKEMGMVPGFPDLIVFWRGFTWAFEVKAEGGRQEQTQKDVQAAFESNGFMYAVVRSVDDVKECVDGWKLTDHSKFYPVPFAAQVPLRGVVS